MTNEDLLTRRHVLQVALQHVSTSRFKYAIHRNLKAVQSDLEAYDETLKSLIQEHDVELDGGRAPDDAPAAFTEDLDKLLHERVQEDVPVHMISEAIFDKEDERCSDIPFDVIGALDFMIRPVTPTHSDADA